MKLKLALKKSVNSRQKVPKIPQKIKAWKFNLGR